MCRIATGAGFGTRTLYSNADETLFQVCRPQLVNGIPDLAKAGDLIDRAIMIELPRRMSEDNASEEELWDQLEADRAEILGALLDAVSTALRLQKMIRLSERPRLVDFARWVEAAAPALGWKAGAFLSDYLENRVQAGRIAVEADPVAAMTLRFVCLTTKFTGTAETLLDSLNQHARDDEKRSQGWPRTAHHLSMRLRRAASALRRAGLVVEFRRGEHARTIVLEKVPQQASGASAASGKRLGNGLPDAPDAADAVLHTSSKAVVHAHAGTDAEEIL
jgi:hypothetical protein